MYETKLDAKTIIEKARRRETTYRLCLRGDLAAEHEAAEAELEALSREGGWTASSLASENPITPLVERIEALQAEMREATVTFRFRALKRLDWEQLLEAHPGREGKAEALNVATLSPALISASLINPTMTPDEVESLFDVLNDAQREELFGAAWSVNTEATSVPFSERASAVTRWRAENSKPLALGESPAASS